MASSAPSGTDEQHLDEVFHILQNRRRRDVIEYLAEVSTTTDTGELAEHIAEREVDDGHVDTSARKRVYIALHQSHLDKMDDAGVINYETGGNRVTRGEDFEDYWNMIKPSEDDGEGSMFDRLGLFD